MVAEEILLFCRNISEADLKKLLFQKPLFEAVTNGWLVNQARCYQMAKSKIPSWWERGKVVFPDPLAVEQASSEWLARWKQTLIPKQINTLVDLSTGLGVDAFFLSKNLKEKILIEPEISRSRLLKENFDCLGLPDIQVEMTDALSFIQSNFQIFGPNTLIYVDPDRRTENNQRIASWKETEPNLRQIVALLKPTGALLMAKLSPLDDLEELALKMPDIQSIYTISLHNEVKEVLVSWNFFETPSGIEKYAVEISRTGVYRTISVDRQSGSPKSIAQIEPGYYLFDPWASIRKGYQTALLPEQFAVQLFSPQSQIFAGIKLQPDFPGRVFRIEEIYPGLKAFGLAFKDKACSVIARGKVESAESIKKKFNLKEGGDQYLFCLQAIDNQIYYIRATRFEIERNPSLWHTIPEDSH